MKTVLGALAIAGAAFISMPAAAHEACRVPSTSFYPQRHTEVRQTSYDDSFEARIRYGVERGTLTRREASRLWSDVAELRELERRAYRDGRLSFNERRRLERKQARLAQELREETFDRDRRGRWGA